MQRKNWFVVTGGPSTGKTTLLAELAKLGYKTTQEAARDVIDEALAAGRTIQDLRSNELEFQERVMRVKIDRIADMNPDKTVFFDRGMHDTIAYLRTHGLPIADWVLDGMNVQYKTVFLLEPVGEFEKDYARVEDEAFVKKINKEFEKAYSEYGMTPIIVPNMSLEKRVQFILDHIQKG